MANLELDEHKLHGLWAEDIDAHNRLSSFEEYKITPLARIPSPDGKKYIDIECKWGRRDGIWYFMNVSIKRSRSLPEVEIAAA